jgi:hypothetical protein
MVGGGFAGSLRRRFAVIYRLDADIAGLRGMPALTATALAAQ